MNVRSQLGLGVFLSILTACQSLEPKPVLEKPLITKDMPLAELYDQSIRFGTEAVMELRDFAKERDQLASLHQLAEKDLLSKAADIPTPMLLNIAHIYRISSNQINPQVFRNLVQSREESVRRVAWRLAANRPSATIARDIENYLSELINRGREGEALLPEAALAIQENQLKSAFSFLIIGLDQKGQPEFANAMLALDPSRAPKPFFDYLNKADFDDLRQLHQQSINLLTCNVIFRFFSENPLPMSHPGVGQLFSFAVSRNRALSEMAFAVLDKHIPDQRQNLALILSRLSTPIQLAFIENSQREATPNLRLLLTDMREVAQQKEVLEELSSVQQGAVER